MEGNPHVVAMPLPAPGHIIPMVHLCKLLASSGFAISLLTTLPNQALVSKLLEHHEPYIQILTIPYDQPPAESPPSWENIRHHLLILHNLQPSVEPTIFKLASDQPPVVCILSDIYLGWMQDVADNLRIPRVALCCSPASDVQVYCQSPRLLSSGYLPFKAPANRSAHDDVDNPIPGFVGTWPRYHRVTSPDDLPCPPIDIPGLRTPLSKADFPSFLQIEDASDIIFHYFINQVQRMPEPYMVVVNSFFELEAPVFTALQKEGNVRPLGPLFMMREKHVSIGNLEENPSDAAAADYKGESVDWLDKQPSNSVIYVAFGGTVPLGPAQIEALATGLEASEKRFLWALLPLEKGLGPSERLPKGFLERIEGRGLVVGWAPQTLVLRHAAVGAFVSHCGWNSVLESLSFGKPIIGFPLLADHLLICKLMEDEWKVGMRLKSTQEGIPCSRDLQRAIKVMMCEETGEEVRKKAGELCVAAEKAICSGGSSYATLHSLVDELKNVSKSAYQRCNLPQCC